MNARDHGRPRRNRARGSKRTRVSKSSKSGTCSFAIPRAVAGLCSSSSWPNSSLLSSGSEVRDDPTPTVPGRAFRLTA